MNSEPLSIVNTFGGPPAGGNHFVELVDHPLASDGTLDDVQQRNPGVLVDH